MSNKRIVIKLINQLKLYLHKLTELKKNYRDLSKKQFMGNMEIQWQVERGLQLAIDCAIDIGKEVIAAGGWQKPDSYKEVFKILNQHQAIDYNLSKGLQRLAGFRNELVHEYLILNHERIYDIWQKELKVLERFLKMAADLVKK